MSYRAKPNWDTTRTRRTPTRTVHAVRRGMGLDAKGHAPPHVHSGPASVTPPSRPSPFAPRVHGWCRADHAARPTASPLYAKHSATASPAHALTPVANVCVGRDLLPKTCALFKSPSFPLTRAPERCRRHHCCRRCRAPLAASIPSRPATQAASLRPNGAPTPACCPGRPIISPAPEP